MAASDRARATGATVNVDVIGARDNGGVRHLVGEWRAYGLVLWVPRQEFPTALRDVSDVTPLGASVEALQRAMQIGFPSATSLLVLGAYSALFSWLAVRFFRWE